MPELGTRSPVAALAEALAGGSVEVLDLTAPLSERTPIIVLPPERGQAWKFQRTEISRYDERGDHVFWNNFSMSEHAGTHFDAPVHWVSGRDRIDVSQVPPADLVAPALVLDASDRVAADPEFLLQVADVEAWLAAHGPVTERSWLLYRTGWDARVGDPAGFLNEGRTPGVHPDCAAWLAEQPWLIGFGVETVGTDAGRAAEFSQPFPCHWHLHGAGKYGLTQLQNLSRLPVRGALLVVSPLPIVGGSGSPARVYALLDGSVSE
ncbi:MAG TPA: cyclase family protein [Jatrophihabitans sp.]|nr:cyclase family protein [Jatrophihabitans sp.]